MMTTMDEADYQQQQQQQQLLLPDEITIEILLLLPEKSVMRCKRVCKAWRALIVDPVFVDLYHHKHPINVVEWLTLCRANNSVDYHFQFGEYNDGSKINNPVFKYSPPIIYRPIAGHHHEFDRMLNTVCSCNGLTFFISILGDDMFVCNPFTREYVDLPLPLSFDHKRFFNMFFNYGTISLASGFGYDSYTDKYKIVIIHYTKECYLECTTGYVTIYTLGSGRWRDKGEISPKLIDHTQPGVFLNGALHWLTKKKEIVSFDLADEEFRIVPSPPPSQSAEDDDHDYVPQLGLLSGYLYVTRKQQQAVRGGGFDSTLDIWVMDNIEMQSWTRKFSIAWKLGDNLSADYYRPLFLSKSGKVILFHSNGYMDSTAAPRPLVSYDPDTKSSIVDDSFSKSSKRFMHIHYVKSLVSLKALGEMNAVRHTRSRQEIQAFSLCKELSFPLGTFRNECSQTYSISLRRRKASLKALGEMNEKNN